MLIEFWIPALGLLVAVGLILLRALQRPPEDGPGENADLRVYRDQLSEVERDIAKGSVSAEEGARMRAEVARRLLEADLSGRAATPARRSAGAAPLVFVLALLGLGAGTYYFVLGAPGYPDLPLQDRLARAAEAYGARPSQDQMEARIGPQGTPPADPADAALLEQLRAAVAARPDDLRGHELLAQSEAGIGNLAGARQAFEQVIALKGEQAGPADHSALAELMIAAAGGIVTPQAEVHLIAALTADPRNGIARYYSGLMLAQVGRPDQAFALWRPLLEEGPPDAPWVQPIRAQIETLAQAAGVNYALPPEAGPDAADIAAAGEMSDEDRSAMIAGMVGTLEARLMESGGTAEDWAKLVTSLGVLGETERAAAALEAGRRALAGDPAGLDLLNAAAGPAP